MYNYKDLCKILKDAVPLTPSPDYAFHSISKSQDPYDLLGKIKYRYERRSSFTNTSLQLSCTGCCPIDQLTGNELLRVLFDLFNKRNQHFHEPGNYLCFSINGKLIAACASIKLQMLSITPSPTIITRDEKKFLYLFSKLFDDVEVNNRRVGDKSFFYSTEIIQSLRNEAKQLYPKFLKLTIAEFFSLPIQQKVFFFPFFGLLVSVAFKSSEKEPMRKHLCDFKFTPFCALIKLSLDLDQTGEITNLFGEIGFQPNYVGNLYLKKAVCAIETAKRLILE